MQYTNYRCSGQELRQRAQKVVTGDKPDVRVAQLDRALGYGPRCREFESSRARMKKGILFGECLFELCFDMNLSHWEKPQKSLRNFMGSAYCRNLACRV